MEYKQTARAQICISVEIDPGQIEHFDEPVVCCHKLVNLAIFDGTDFCLTAS